MTVTLEGPDADRFVDDLLHPSSDPRRLRHLERSDAVYAATVGPPIHSLDDIAEGKARPPLRPRPA